VLPNELAPFWTRTEPHPAGHSRDVVTPDVPNFGIEVRTDAGVLHTRAIAVATVVRPSQVALVVSRFPRCPRPRVKAGEVQVLEKRERTIDAVRLIGADAGH